MIASMSPSPDLSGDRTLAIWTLAVGFGVIMLLTRKITLNLSLGDTDDATRLVMVRDLLHAGRGWYDQAVYRYDPPHGVFMHWSRLVDGGIAAVMWLVGSVSNPQMGEWGGRFLWPLLWVFPLVGGALALARNLGGRSAVFLTLPLLLVDLQLYRQFVPGRIDHHNIQIAMTTVALACATARRQRPFWAGFGGVATAFGLAVGLEALPLQALIGASYGVALAINRKAAPPALSYGLCLAVATIAFFLIQTPPWRWSMSFCDALALNLTAGLTVVGVGLTLTALAAPRAALGVRLGLLSLTALCGVSVYLGLDPQCIHGPFAAMDPAVRPFWFNHIQEVLPLPAMIRLQRGAVIIAITMLVMANLAGAFLVAREWRRPGLSSCLVAVCLVVSSITAYFAWRMQDYVFAIGLPALGAAYSLIAARRLRDLMAPSILAAVILTPTFVAAAVSWGLDEAAGPVAVAKRPHANAAAPGCFSPTNFHALAALTPGRVLAIQDLGPFVVAMTPHSVIAAPYHRMSKQILAVHEVLDAPPAQAEARVRALGADYIVDCPTYPLMSKDASFGPQLRRGPTPPWLERVSAPKDRLQIYRVRPLAAPRPI